MTGPNKPPRWRDALAQARRAFAEAGLDEAALDARLLAAHAFGTDATGLVIRADEPLAAESAGRLDMLVRRRLAGEPVGRILGQREFWGLPFLLSPETLEPRPDSETIVEAALARVGDRRAPLRVLDLGTGTGCLLIALLHELPGATGIGIDLQEGAARTARANARANGVGERADFICGSWADALACRFDLVVSNPPYIRTAEIAALAPEVARHDPGLALDGGRDGLDAYRAILRDLPGLLAPGGHAVLEIGFDQAGDLAGLSEMSGFAVLEVRRDLAGQPRAVTLMQHQGLAADILTPM